MRDLSIKSGLIINGTVSVATGSVIVHNAYTVGTAKTLATKEYVDSVASGGTSSLPDIIAAGSIGNIYGIPNITYDTKGRITNTSLISTTNSYYINGGNTFSGTFSSVIGNNNSGIIIKGNGRDIMYVEGDTVEIKRASYQSYPVSITNLPSFKAQNIFSTIDDGFFSRFALGYFLTDYNSHAVLIETNGGTLNIGATALSNSLSSSSTPPIVIDYNNKIITTNYSLSTYRKSTPFNEIGTTEIERTDIINNPIFYDKNLSDYLIVCSASSTQTLKIRGYGGTGYKTITVDSEYQVARTGSGTVEFLADSGTTIISNTNYLKVALNGVVNIKYIGSSTYLIWGDLIA